MLLIGSLVFSVSCARGPSEVRLGKTTETELLSLKGDPAQKFANGSSETMIYQGDEPVSFQLGNGEPGHRVVQGAYRTPSREERNLNYWQRLWAVDPKLYQRLPGTHAEQLLEITNAKTSVSIVYDLNRETVVRVMEFVRVEK
ncbi:MAG: hypothetical protein RBT63_05020 [Bdellovibrionales bacterium]|nr:hypothetical protein [Bdellovibrionales bacterium]